LPEHLTEAEHVGLQWSPPEKEDFDDYLLTITAAQNDAQCNDDNASATDAFSRNWNVTYFTEQDIHSTNIGKQNERIAKNLTAEADNLIISLEVSRNTCQYFHINRTPMQWTLHYRIRQLLIALFM
jgi:hypothetical protein